MEILNRWGKKVPATPVVLGSESLTDVINCDIKKRFKKNNNKIFAERAIIHFINKEMVKITFTICIFNKHDQFLPNFPFSIMSDLPVPR